jgi:ABC-type transporter Mla subunit MlaD
MKNMRHVSAEGGKELVSLIKEVRDTNKGVQQRLQTIETELTKTLGQAGRGFSEAEQAVKDVRSILSSNEDNIGSLIAHLDETTQNLAVLSEDLRLHPWKVVWKADGAGPASNAAQWREKGRIGPYGKN